MNLKKGYLLLFILPLFAFTAHKFYLSLTDITYIEKEKSVQIIMNVFMDDIELAVNKQYNIDLQLSTKKEFKSADDYFEKYLNEFFKIKINDKQLPYKYLGKEYDGDIVYFYLEISNINQIKNIEISNKVLVKEFNDQQNIVKITVGKDKQSEILTKKNDTLLLKF
jgi:uncharacterized protein YuzE